jgi:hypothetical protein
MWRVGLVGLLVARVAAADCEVASKPPISVEVAGTTATLTYDGRTRVIRAKTCDELAKSVAVVIEMVLAAMKAEPAPTEIDPTPEEPPSASDPPTTGEVPATPSASDPPMVGEVPATFDQPKPPVVSTPSAIDTEDPSIEVGAAIDPPSAVEHDAFASFGTSSSLGASMTLGVRSRWGSVSIAGELEGELPTDLAMGVSIVRTSAALVPCKHLGPFAACAVVRAGFDHGSGSGLMNARSAFEPRAEFGARLAWEQPVTEHLALQLRGELDLAATTSQFDVDNVAVWRSNRFAGLAGAGVVVRFP